ncbi:MAG: leucine-rich repeat protein, partial [Lachnospiraceae bacterium]|nr:leucine-rich repeat protein [Lachnospiraceae bacterium]
RKTVGALFLISSLLVAAIPVDNFTVAADTTENTLFPAGGVTYTVTQSESTVPKVDTNETVYTSGDGKYQYAYVYKNNQNAGDKVAVILGYSAGQLDNNALVIPDTLDIYKKQTHSQGSGAGYIAVGKDGNDLWYGVREQDKNEDGTLKYTPKIDPETGKQVVDENGDYVMEPEMTTVLYPCYYEDYDKWGTIASGELWTPDKDYADMTTTIWGVNDPEHYHQTRLEAEKRVQSIDVCYIGNQRLITNADGSWSIGEWITPEAVEAGTAKGVFADNGNIVSLTVGDKLEGIGDFAFFGCTGLSSIKLGNGISTLGNYAFANCINLKSADVELYCNLKELGNHTFYNCEKLTSFEMPVNIREIGDYCFSKCRAMTELKMYDVGYNTMLETLGNYCFTDCNSLERLVFPSSIRDGNGSKVDLSLFEGATGLKSICFMGDSIDVTANNGYTFDQFKKAVTSEFYFEGLNQLALHKTANDNEIAYKYVDQDLFEIVIRDKTTGASVTYRVDSNDVLKDIVIDGNVEIVDMPDTIGPQKIITIDSTSFTNKCSIKKVTIPASVQVVSENAFKGCHNLQHVIFEDADNIQTIGQDAFQTQKVNDGICIHASSLEYATPVLTFTGTVSNDSVPFQYAMDPNSKINQGTQPVTYITYYSGWPSNLTIQYTEDANAATLMDYPTLSDLSKYSVSSGDAGYPYMTEEYIKAASAAAAKLYSSDSLTEDERAVVDACLNIVIPEGVTAVKKDLFATNEVNDLKDFSDKTKTLTTNTITNISNGMFADWKNLSAAYILGDATTIGDYAFKGCEQLEVVQISPNVEYLGLRPFAGCEKLAAIDFLGSENFVCEKNIIFSLEDGNKDTIIECLESRGVTSGVSGVVQGKELVGVTGIQNEAFMDCLGISEVDLKQTTIDKVPSKAFALDSERELTDSDFSIASSKMNRVLLPSTCKSIEAKAFENSPIVYLEIPSSVTYIDPDAFNTEKNSSNPEQITFYCEPDSAAAIYADNHESIDWIEREPDPETHMVTIQYLDPATQQYHTIEIQNVLTGGSALKPALEDLPVIEGYSFLKWLPSDDFSNILADCTFTAIYSDTQYTVNFFECDEHGNTPIGSITVAEGANVTELDYPEYTPQEGYTIVGWTGLVNPVTENLNVYAKCQEASYTVNFWVNDASGEKQLVYTQTGKLGDAVYQPRDPQVDNATFTGWMPTLSATITGNADYYATFVDSNGNVIGGGNNTGAGDGSSNGSDSDNSNNNGSSDTTPTPTPAPTQAPTKFYTLTVKNGSGSGSYAAGQDVIIIADDPVSGQTFSKWTVDPSDVKIASKTVEATVLTMPEKNVTVTASYKKSASTGSGTGSSSNTGGTSHITGGNVTTNGSTVVIDKNGLSNTGVVSVKVNGSSDNFTVKIQESAYAKEQAIKALIAEYGDLTNIVYFPMDISLYDSTGTKMITDTTGLSITITLPLPDSMITYAGNNKVASVTDGVLEKLGAKFTTIDGVSCITFTAEHFSPYVIYVDKGNLTAGTVNDDTPKTGDGIHPKWFLSVGLLCIAMILFLKKDKAVTPVRRVAAAR